MAATEIEIKETVTMVTDAHAMKDAQETIVQEKMIRGREHTRVTATTKILESFVDTRVFGFSLSVVGLSSIQPFFPLFNRGKRSFDAFRQGSIAPLLAYYDFRPLHTRLLSHSYVHGNSTLHIKFGTWVTRSGTI